MLGYGALDKLQKVFMQTTFMKITDNENERTSLQVKQQCNKRDLQSNGHVLMHWEQFQPDMNSKDALFSELNPNSNKEES